MENEKVTFNYKQCANPNCRNLVNLNQNCCSQMCAKVHIENKYIKNEKK